MPPTLPIITIPIHPACICTPPYLQSPETLHSFYTHNPSPTQPCLTTTAAVDQKRATVNVQSGEQVPVFVHSKSFRIIFIQLDTSAGTHEYSEKNRASKYVCCLATSGTNTAGSLPSRRRGILPSTRDSYMSHNQINFQQTFGISQN